MSNSLTWRDVAIILGILGLTFSAGENWHRLDGAEASIQGLSRQEDQIKQEYARKDVLQEQLNTINLQLREIRQSLTKGK